MKNKYNAQKTGGFDSRKEQERFWQLRTMENRGEIEDLHVQVPFELIPSQTYNGKFKERAVKYIADFTYRKNGELVVEDVKGYRKGAAYSVFSIKRKLMLQKYGIAVREI